MDEIEKNLYLGDLGSLKECKSFGIDIIVTTLHFKPTLPTNIDTEIQHIYFPALDEDDFEISKYFNEFICIIETNANKKILVHCYSGMSRSATLIASYFVYKFVMKKKLKKSSVENVIKYIKKKRQCVSPNVGFINQLETFRKCLIKS